MIDNIKKEITGLIGKKVKILVDIGRNKSEIYEGIIQNTYKNVWTIKVGNDIKSFGYSDVLINMVNISS